MYTFLAWIISAFAVIAGIIYSYLTWNFNYWRKFGLRTAEPLTIFGSLPNIVTKKRNFIYDIDDLYKKYKNDNRAVGIFVTRNPQILLLHPKLIHDVLVTNFTQFRDSITSSWVDDRKEDTLVSRNPFWSAGEEWKEHRSIVSTGLTLNKLKLSYAIWQNSCKKLRKFLGEQNVTGSGLIEAKNIAYRFCADVMCDFLWGVDSKTLTKPKEPNTMINVASKWTTYLFIRMNYYPFISIAPFLRKVFPKRFFPKDTDEFFLNLQKDALDMRRKHPIPDRQDFLNHLIQLSERKGATLEDFTGHSLTAMLDGYETTGTVLVNYLYELANNFRVQEKLRSEILSALDEGNGQLSYESLISLPYLDQTTYEILRLSTAIPTFNRICVEPTTLEIDEGKNVLIPKGMVAIVSAYSLHRDERFFPDPSNFNPERFDNAAHVEMMKQNIFLPFGDGPRICLGSRVALLSLKSSVVEILSQYEIRKCALSPKADSKNKKSFILTFEGDVWLEFKKFNTLNN